LPPVMPPTGKQILRLFVVPAIIVLILVGLFLLGPTLSSWFGALFGRASADSRSADQFLRDLDSSNNDVRWRAASDLAQVLLRKDELASDPDFALALADRLQTALQRNRPVEQATAPELARLSLDKEEDVREWHKIEAKLEPERNYVQFLTACLGNFMLPVGAGLLGDMATEESGMEPEALAQRRRRALFALATLGENLKRFDKLSAEQQDAIREKLRAAQKDADVDRLRKDLEDASKNRQGKAVLAVLQKQLEEAEKKNPGKKRARDTLAYLEARRKDRANTLGVTEVLAKCAGDDDDPSVRFMAAFAANFWHGTPAEEKIIEGFLVKLSNDVGSGADKLEERLRRNPNTKDSREVTTTKGFDVQVNANIALARRGSPRVRMDLLRVMLDPDALGEIFVFKQTPSPASTRRFLFWTWTTPAVPPQRPNEALVVLTVTDTLKAIVQLHHKQPRMKLDSLIPLIDKLTESDNPAIRKDAEQTQQALKEVPQAERH
jgi:hypothetical protein